MIVLVLITYDVSVVSDDGKKRLRNIAKICMDYGVRVQNSVFECDVDSAQFALLKARLIDIFDPGVDSLRFYFLGKNGRKNVEHVGANPVQDCLRDALVI